jgi:hypothetical protein
MAGRRYTAVIAVENLYITVEDNSIRNSPVDKRYYNLDGGLRT